jgi:ubiquinone/menaquinone biosynthesis C-methylase UbiE
MTASTAAGRGEERITTRSAAETIKNCCEVAYSSDLVSLLLGDSYHPGGLKLTRRLLQAAELRPGERMLDVAAGVGTTCLLVATDYDAVSDGVDISAANVTVATDAAASLNLTDRAVFHRGDAEALPLPDESFDVVACECALCTFPDKPTAVAEMARVLRPGGRLGITDIAADHARLPAALSGLAGWVACMGDARSLQDYRRLLDEAGMRTTLVEHHHNALEQMIWHVAARLDLLRMTAGPRLEALGVDFNRVRPVLEAARAAVLDGILDYVLIVAEKPG